MSKLFLIAVLCAVCGKLSALREKSNFSTANDIEKCRINDERCLLKSSNKVIKKYHGGIPGIGLASLDPFIVSKLKLNHDYGALRANGTVQNIKLHGLSTATIVKFSGFDKNLLEIHFKVPKFTATGYYKATGEIIGFKIRGDGPFMVNFYDIFIKFTTKLEPRAGNGNTYFRTVESGISSTVRTGDVSTPSLSRALIWLINTSFDVVLKSSFKSYAGDVWAVFYEQIINAILNKVPIEDLFLI